MTAAALTIALLLQDPNLGRVRQTAYARVAKARAIARDERLVAFVVAKNADQESLEQIRRKDAAWIGVADSPLRRSLTQNECSARLRSLVADDPVVVEVLLMDDRGALVCATLPPSDYWQGDEPKWQQPFRDGRDPFVDEPALDASTNRYAIQLSVPVARQGRRIGVLTLTLKVPRQTGVSRDAPQSGPGSGAEAATRSRPRRLAS